MNTVLRSLVILIVVACCIPLHAQEHHHKTHDSKNIVAISYGYVYVNKGIPIESRSSPGHLVPSVGIDYLRQLGRKWELQAVFDYELDHYVITGKDIERENAALFLLGAYYTVYDHLAIMLGAGLEWDKHHTLMVGRVGLEYGIQLGHKWVLSPGIHYDFKEIHNTSGFKVALGYRF